MTTNPIATKIANLRAKLTQWIWVRGIGQWLLIAVGILILDMVLDRLFKMDFAQRSVMLVCIGLGLVATLVWKALRPLWLRPTDESLVYEVQDKHPELRESLLSAFQLERQRRTTDTVSGVSDELVDATIQKGFSDAENIDFASVLDSSQQRIGWTMLLLGAGLAATIGIGSLGNTFLNTWFRRNILLTDDQWPQETYLQIVGAGDGVLAVPRGADHRQQVIVSDDSAIDDVSVSLEIETPSGRSIVPMKRTGGANSRRHAYLFRNVSSRFRMRAVGGDDVTNWVQVNLVEPPAIENLTMKAVLPEYTGAESIELTGPGPFSVLRNSQLAIQLSASQPVAEAAVINGANSTVLSTSDNRSFTGAVPSEGGLAGGEYEICLTSPSGVSNARKTKFKVTVKDDQSPVVRASLLGISGLVVPKATIPVSFTAEDEYGIERLGFNCGWKSVVDGQEVITDDHVIEFAHSGSPGLLASPVRSIDEVVPLELTTLDLLPGTRLRFSVHGKDFYPEAENIGRSQEFLLRVVTEAELRSDLLRREIEQRQAFDQAYQAQLQLATELQTIVLRQSTADQSAADFFAAQEQSLITAAREQKSIGTRVTRIADRFEEFLVEVKNNKLDQAELEVAPEQTIEQRFDKKIVRPIRYLDENSIALSARHMDHCRAFASDPEALKNAARQANVAQQETLEQMKIILSAMNDSESFQQVVNQIISIRNANDELINRIDADNNDKGDGQSLDEDSIFD